MSGWGLLNETGLQGSQTMQYVSLPILADDSCTKAYGQMVTFDTSLQFCAGNNLGQDACSGDSGELFTSVYQILKDEFYQNYGKRQRLYLN